MFLWRSFFYYVCTHRFLVVLLQDDLLMNGWYEWDSQNILGPRKGHDKVWSLKAINKMAIWELLLLFLGLFWLFNKTGSEMVQTIGPNSPLHRTHFDTIKTWSTEEQPLLVIYSSFKKQPLSGFKDVLGISFISTIYQYVVLHQYHQTSVSTNVVEKTSSKCHKWTELYRTSFNHTCKNFA